MDTFNVQQPTLRAAGVALVSVVLAVVIGESQQRSLGDDPISMIVAGSVLAALAGAMQSGPPALAGLAAMAGFPVSAAVDLTLHGGHNLWPIEFAFYGLYGVLGVVLALGGRFVRALITRAK